MLTGRRGPAQIAHKQLLTAWKINAVFLVIIYAGCGYGALVLAIEKCILTVLR